LKRKKRTYSPHALKLDYSYTLEQITDLYGVDIATVRRWIRLDGLKRIPKVRPFLVHSGDLKAFLVKRQKDRRQPCAPSEAYCLTCRHPRTPQIRTGSVEPLPNGTCRFKAKCSYCGGKIFKTIGRLKWSEDHPLATYLRDASAQHNGVHSQPPKCSHGKDL
jgi:hypothetical protein